MWLENEEEWFTNAYEQKMSWPQTWWGYFSSLLMFVSGDCCSSPQKRTLTEEQVQPWALLSTYKLISVSRQKPAFDSHLFSGIYWLWCSPGPWGQALRCLLSLLPAHLLPKVVSLGRLGLIRRVAGERQGSLQAAVNNFHSEETLLETLSTCPKSKPHSLIWLCLDKDIFDILASSSSPAVRNVNGLSERNSTIKSIIYHKNQVTRL